MANPVDHPAPGSSPARLPQPPPEEPRASRISAVWTAVSIAGLLLVLLLVFIVENGEQVKVSYFGASGHLPLGVTLLLAAVGGALVVGVVGVARVFQLRLAVRRARRGRSRARSLVPGRRDREGR